MFEPITVLVSVAISLLIVYLFTPKRENDKTRIKALENLVEALIDDFKHGERKLDEKIDNVAKNARKTDEGIVSGVDALANHFKVEIIPYIRKEEVGFEIIKLKKKK